MLGFQRGGVYPQTTAGAQVGGYEILSRLAVGGMAELFLARARRALGFEKLVVLKRILPSLAHDPTFAAMFFDEARIAASLDHPHLIHVFDIDESAGTYYIAMEYVHGVDLRRLNTTLWSRGDRLPFDVALTIGIGIASDDHVLVIHRANDAGSGLDRTEYAVLKEGAPRVGECCMPAPPVLEFDPNGNLVRSWGGPAKDGSYALYRK
jgi:serine/threonine protein kinase